MSHRRRASRVIAIIFVCLAAAIAERSAPGGSPGGRENTNGPFQASGLKVGEVTDTTAIVWTRLTARPGRNPGDGPMVMFKYKDEDRWTPYGHTRSHRAVVDVKYPPGVTVADIADAVPGTPGDTRVCYKKTTATDWTKTAWQPVDAGRDFTRQFLLTGLSPGAKYDLRIESRSSGGDVPGQSIHGSFQTVPAREVPARVIFTVSTGQGYWSQDCPDGYRIYQSMLDLDPSFFVHTGDIVYYDRIAKTEELARYLWQATYSLPGNVRFHNRVASYFIKDDHDTWQNDCWPGMQNDKMLHFTFEQGLRIFPEQVPMGERTYRTRRWGKDLQVWFVEGRDYRSPNTMSDGPQKTVWGKTQMAWFKKAVEQSDATFRVLISPTPVVGPDRKNKRDNHANEAFRHEGDELRRFIAAQKNMAVVCGDRHWQYHSIDPKTGVREYSCGPVSDSHAGGWSDDQYLPDYHRFLKVAGGFLSVTAERVDNKPTLTFRFHDVHGKVRFEDQLDGIGED